MRLATSKECDGGDSGGDAAYYVDHNTKMTTWRDPRRRSSEGVDDDDVVAADKEEYRRIPANANHNLAQIIPKKQFSATFLHYFTALIDKKVDNSIFGVRAYDQRADGVDRLDQAIYWVGCD
jgi:hypothetical protein